MESNVVVPKPRACSGHISIYQRGLESHARVAVDFWEDDWKVPHSCCHEDHVILALLPQTPQPGRASATRTLPPSPTNVQKLYFTILNVIITLHSVIDNHNTSVFANRHLSVSNCISYLLPTLPVK